MITVVTLLKLKPSPNGERHGERPFWREWGERYLDAWLATVARHVPRPHRVVVMTDSEHPLPWPAERVPLDTIIDAPGFWAKLNMFRVTSGKTLYCDLDNCINGDLSALCALTPDPLMMLDDRRVPGLPNGSMVLFDAERCRAVWARYIERPRRFERDFVARGEDYTRAYDQAFIADTMTALGEPPAFLQDFLPPGYILNARSELPNASDWRAARVIFGGGMEKEGKPHLSKHPAFSLDESRFGGW